MKQCLLGTLGAAALTTAKGQTMEESHARWDAAIRMHRMGTLVVHTEPGTTVRVTQLRHVFPFGAALSHEMFGKGTQSPEDRARYLEIVRTHFNAGVPETCLKWHHTGKEGPDATNYTDADRMLEWCEDNGIRLRGHTLFRATPEHRRGWVTACSADKLREHMEQRCRQIVRRYQGRVDEFDVNSGMAHGRFFRDRLGEEIVPEMFRWAKAENPGAILYLNDFRLLSGDSGPKFVAHTRKLIKQGVPVGGVACQGHFEAAQSLREVEERLNALAELGLPITISEFGVRTGTPAAKAQFLDGLCRLCFAHPQVAGILMGEFWEGRHRVRSAALWRRDWSPTPMAEAYERLVLGEWWTRFEGKADTDGICRIRAFFGRHRVEAAGKRLDVRFAMGDGPKLAVDLLRGPRREADVLSCAAAALYRGVWELALRPHLPAPAHSLGCDLRVTFTRPDGTRIAVDGFHDGNGVFRARAYCDAVGSWRWETSSSQPALRGKSGTFEVRASELPGKLRIHPADPYQFAFDNGEWFLHIGDTGYRCVTDTEPEWQAYVDQAARLGVTKIRTWLCRSRGSVEALLTSDRGDLDLAFWQEIDHRLVYALERYPRLQFQLIPYGEDTAELLRYAAGDNPSQAIARIAQARWSAFPNVTWCIANDREIVKPGAEFKRGHVPSAVINRIGRDMAAREPWGTLLTNHQSRWKGYSFTDAPWSDIVTLEDMDQIGGELILRYRDRAKAPVVNDEDRYEHHRQPKHPRYFFRRLMWASLLSGGHATYGGLRTYEAYDGNLRGVQGYFDACTAGKLRQGAHDFRHIHTFFKRTGISLAGWIPDDKRVGSNPHEAKCCRKADRMLVYLANPTGSKPETDDAGKVPAICTVTLAPGTHTVRWFEPRIGAFVHEEKVDGPEAALRSPAPGDWMVLLNSAAGSAKEANGPDAE